MQPILKPSPLTLRESVLRFSYYAFGIAALWAVAFVLYLAGGQAI